MTTISEETYSRGCEGRWYATAGCSSCSTGVCCWSSLAAVSQQLPCRPYQFSVILQPFFLSHPHSLSLARRPQVPRQQYRHGVYRHFISTTPPVTNWHQSWYTRVKLGGIPPPDLRSGTSCLRSTTSNNRYCTSQPRSGTFLLGSTNLHSIFLCVWCFVKQEAQLSLRDRTMRRVSWNLANCHATVQKLLVQQVLNKSKLWSRRVKVGRCVINMCTQR